MVENGVTLQGMDKLLKNLQSIGATAKDIKPDLIKAMEMPRDAAKRHAKSGSAHQAAIIVKDKSEGDDIRIAMGVFAESALNYIVFIEYGTGIYAENGQGRTTPWVFPLNLPEGLTFRWTQGMHSSSFIRRAWDEEKDNVLKYSQRAIKARLERITS